MSNRIYQRGRSYTDPTSSRHNAKYHQRGGKNYRPEPNRRVVNGDDVDTLMASLGRHLTTDGTSNHNLSSGGRNVNQQKNQRFAKKKSNTQSNQIGWWRITVQKAGEIGKDRVMAAIQSQCVRPFQPYHYSIEARTKAGVFFVNNQNDADMIKRLNGKVEVQSLDILRIVTCRIPAPAPSLDEDIKPHFKDYLLNRRFNQQTFQLDLSNLADDEELTSLGIFPQFNKQAFIRDVIEIINKDLHMTRQLDLGSNNIMNLYEFRNLHLNNLIQMSFATNQLKNVDDFDHLKQLPNLSHISIRNNPVTLPNNKRNNSISDIISCILQQAIINWSISYHSSLIRQKLPQLKRIDDIDLPPAIRFATDIETASLPKSIPHHVPNEMQSFLGTFIQQFYQFFDTPGREGLHACYHDLCMFSLCITTIEHSIVPTRQSKYGPLIYESRNLQKINDDHRRVNLLRHGKAAVLDFLRVKFPTTKHDGNSFRVDVMTTANNRAIFTINGLYKEGDQITNCPIRCFQRTFTCAQTANGVLIIADHILISNATEAQFLNTTRSTPTPAPAPTNHHDPNTNAVAIQNQMVQKFSHESGMNFAYSKQCLQENNWNYDRAAEVFLDLQNKNQIPAEAFVKT